MTSNNNTSKKTTAPPRSSSPARPRIRKKRVLPNRQANRSFASSCSTLTSIGEDYLNQNGDIPDDASLLSWEEDLHGELFQEQHPKNSNSRNNYQHSNNSSIDHVDFDLEFSGLHLSNKSHKSSRRSHNNEDCHSESFHDSFSMGASLGSGAFGHVHRCHMIIQTKAHKRLSNHNDNTNRKDSKQDDSNNNNSGDCSQTSFAVKSVAAEHYNPQEIDILQQYLQDCPTVVHIQSVFHEAQESLIVMEEMHGGDLLQRIATKLCYPEDQAQRVMRTLLETIQYCHDRGVAHCDIKPENILLVSPDSDTDIKLTDFGMAKVFLEDEPRDDTNNHSSIPHKIHFNMLEMEGSAEYAAPEVFNRSEDDTIGYDERCDIWSCGVCLYVLLAGYAPFEADTADDMIATVGKGKFKFHKRYWKDVSKDAKRLIVKLMQVDPDKRCTIQEALASPWLKQIEDAESHT